MLGWKKATELAMTSFIRSTGSVTLAALFKKTEQHDWEVGTYSRTVMGAMHLIGKLMPTKLNLPLNI